MSDDSQSPSFSLARVLLLVVPVVVLAYAAKMYSRNLETTAQANLEKNIITQLLGPQETGLKLSSDYNDEDGDLLADPPKEEAKLVDPEEIRFSYVATSDSSNEEETWKEFVDALSKRLDRPVKLVSFTDAEEQKREMRDGTLHIAAFGTGDVVGAVNRAGFIPTACLADKDGKYSYTMKIIVPSDSNIENVEDLKPKTVDGKLQQHRFTFVRPGSNSGFTAALVLLMDKYDLLPERDYRYGFSYSHEKSIDGVAKKDFEAASVASDILERRIASGEVSADQFRTIYESDPYPSGVIGVAYDLKPELIAGIKETLLGFDFAGTGLEKAFGGSGATKFVEVSYKKDWEPVREIGEASAEAHADLQTASR